MIKKIVAVLVAGIILVFIYLYVRLMRVKQEIELSLEIGSLTTKGLLVSFKVRDKLIKKMDILQGANLVSATNCVDGVCTVTINIINLDDLEVYFFGKNTLFRINLKEIIKNKLENE